MALNRVKICLDLADVTADVRFTVGCWVSDYRWVGVWVLSGGLIAGKIVVGAGLRGFMGLWVFWIADGIWEQIMDG